MRLVQILYSGLGGHGSVAFSLAEASPADWAHEFIFFGIEPTLPEYEKICEKNGYGSTYVGMRQGSSWRAWRQLHKELVSLKPEAILLHSVKTIVPCWYYAKSKGIPLIAAEHQPNALKKRSEWVVSHLLMRLARSIVVLTPTYRQELKSTLGRSWAENKVYTIPNGINIDQFAPANRVPNSPIRVGMAARFSNKKRQNLLVEAMRILTNRDGENAWRLSLAGDGDELKIVRTQIQNLGLDSVIDLPGYLGEQDLQEWFSKIDIYTHASDGETLSTSLLQAMACGLPILGSNVDGISNLLIQDTSCGLLSPSETAEGFAEGLTQLASKPDEAKSLSTNARTLACEQYSNSQMFNRYASLLSQ